LIDAGVAVAPVGRVWPLTAFVVLLLFGSCLLVQRFGAGDLATAGQVDPGRFMQHVLFVQGWTHTR
jgi:hypothetical protein